MTYSKTAPTAGEFYGKPIIFIVGVALECKLREWEKKN